MDATECIIECIKNLPLGIIETVPNKEENSNKNASSNKNMNKNSTNRNSTNADDCFGGKDDYDESDRY